MWPPIHTVEVVLFIKIGLLVNSQQYNNNNIRQQDVEASYSRHKQKEKFPPVASIFCTSLNSLGEKANMFTELSPYFHLVLVEANHVQGFPHHLPITAIVDGAHFGTVTLWKTHKRDTGNQLKVL